MSSRTSRYFGMTSGFTFKRSTISTPRGRWVWQLVRYLGQRYDGMLTTRKFMTSILTFLCN